MKRLLFAGIAAVVLGSATALAADMPVKAAPAPAPVFNWTGFYGGANGGYGWNVDPILADTAVGPIPGAKPNGWFGGGQLGYNWQTTPNWVWGIETDLQGADISDSKVAAPGVLFNSSRLTYFGTVRGRIGYAMDRTLLYFTGGFAYGHLHDEICCALRTFNGTATGYALGGGLEYKLNPAWSVKLEYQYLNFGHNDATLAGVSACTLAGVVCREDAFHTVRLGLNYKFGDPWGKAPVVAKY